MSIRNLDFAFKPASVALIGASREEGSVGAVVARNLFGAGFDGPVLPVNPHARSIASALAYRDIASLPLAPDLAVICTPPHTVPEVIDQLGRRGTKAAVVITAGFAELGAEGRALQDQMLTAARPHLLRVIGPNCLGVLVPGRKLNASFAHLSPPAGPIAFVAQSGAMLASVLDWAATRGIGFSHLVSMGGMADVDFGDMLDYLAAQPETRAILLYIEAVTEARKFLSGARSAARLKPVIVIKAGRHAEGARAAASHTGALAGSDPVYDAAFRRAGMLRVMEMEELFAAAETLSAGIRLSGDRLAILTNGGGMGVLATDRLIDEGGQLAELSPETCKRLDAVLPPTWSKGNPVDIIGDAPGARYRAALEVLLADPGVGAVLALNCPTAIADPIDAARAVAEGAMEARHAGRDVSPVLAAWLGGQSAARAEPLFAAAGIPSYPSADRAIQAFMHLVRHGRNRRQLLEAPPADPETGFEPDMPAVRAPVDKALDDKRSWLTEPEAKAVLSAYGIPIAPAEAAATAEEAVRIAERLGWPAVLKILSPDILHKSDAGGVALGLKNPDALRTEADAMLARVSAVRPEARIDGFSVGPMVRMAEAHELIIGMADDPTFGPVLLFGTGGVEVEVVRDRAIGFPPLNRTLALSLIKETRISRLLRPFRGRKGVDLDALSSLLVRVSRLIVEVPEILEMDINPLLAGPDGLIGVDVRMRVGPPEMRRPLAIRPYPRDLEETARLNDGSSVRLRPIRPEDQPALCNLVAGISPEDRRLRFLASFRSLPPELAARLSQIDYDREMALVAVPDKADSGDGILGVVHLAADPDKERAEYAVLVRGDLKGRGLGWLLMRRIIDYARKQGIGELFGEVLAENTTMLRMAEELGFSLKYETDEPQVVEVRMELQADRTRPFR